MVRSVRESLPEVRKWPGDPPEGLELVGDPPGSTELIIRLSRRSGSGRVTLPKVQKW